MPLELSEKQRASADPPCHIVTEPSHLARVRGVNGNIALTADEMTRLRVIDHDAFKVQVTVFRPPVSAKKATRRLRIYQLHINAWVWEQR